MPTSCNRIRGRVLQVLRERKNLSQEELAHLVGVTKQTIYNLERGKSWGQIDFISKLCSNLNIEVVTLSNLDKEFNLSNIDCSNIDSRETKKYILERIHELLNVEDITDISRKGRLENE